MRKIQIIYIIILLLLLAISIFSITLSYKVISNFRVLNIYNKAIFLNDIEFSLVVMGANILGDIGLLFYFFKSGFLNQILHYNKDELT